MRDENELERIQASIRAPRAAALAGIAFSLILGTVIVLIRSAVPASADDAELWMDSSTKRGQVTAAMAVLPFAGIAFLWFIGVIRDRIGEKEDRFFATVFLGSGLIFIALLFAAGAVATTLLTMAEDAPPSGELWTFGRRLTLTLMNTYALRTAAVFTLAATTLAGRLGLLPRWLMVSGYLTALVLLFVVAVAPALELIFPLWVLLVSGHILIVAGRRTSEARDAS